MQRASLGWTVFVSLGLVAVVGCAVGTDPNAVSEANLTNLAVEAGDENSIVLPPPSNPGEDAGTGEDSGGSDGGTTDAAADSGGGTDAGPTFSCTSPNVCLGATDLGSVSGDEGANIKTYQGSGSQWLKVRVSEDDSSIDGTKLQVRAELTSPAGTNFDLFLYRAGSSTGQECSAVTATSTSTGGFDFTSSEWGEGAISNGNDDDRTVTLEVRHISGACAAAAKWTLTVKGNAL